jgi:biotin carboxyl carrier protein
VPQIAGVFGDCIAGGGYMPIISDRVYMTEQAYMVIAGAALIKGAKSQKLSSLDIGGPEVHVHLSGCADVRVPDDETALALIRARSQAPLAAVDFYRHGAGAAPPADAASCAACSPATTAHLRREQVLARLVDRALFWELCPSAAARRWVGVGRVGGLYGLRHQPPGPDRRPRAPRREAPRRHPLPRGHRQGRAFSRACNDDGIPLVWLQDISGFDIGVEAERQGLLGYGSNLIYTNSTNSVPMFTCSCARPRARATTPWRLPYEPVVQLSTPITRQSVMEGRTLAIAAFNTKLDDDFEIVTPGPGRAREDRSRHARTEKRIEADMDPYKSGRPDGHRRDRRARRAPRLPRRPRRELPKHRLPPLPPCTTSPATGSADEEPAHLDRRPLHDLGKLVFRAPTAGRWYTRPGPGKPALIEVGTEVRTGQAVGLIEVMKTFSRLHYNGGERGGEGLPPLARIKAILIKDEEDVAAGDALFEVET